MPVIVFDIDDSICKKPSSILGPIDEISQINKECIIIDYISSQKEIFPHIFVPHIDFLIKYLLDHHCQIMFFSSAIKDRNEYIIPVLLKKILGEQQYIAYKESGQFKIFSRKDMRLGGMGPGEGNNVKDLSIICEDTEDIILVEDDSSYVAFNQRPCIKVLDCMKWCLKIEDQDSKYVFSKNTIYHLLGLFKKYFENFSPKPIREAFDIIVPKEEDAYLNDFIKREFKLQMILDGFDMVKSQDQSARLYGMEKFSYYVEGRIPSIEESIEFIRQEIDDIKSTICDKDSEINVLGDSLTQVE